MPDSALLAELSSALDQSAAEGYQRGYAQAQADFYGQNAAFLFANIFADAMEAAAARLGIHDPGFAAQLHGFAAVMRASVQPPSVSRQVPKAGTTNVPSDATVCAIFDIDMDPASITTDTLSVAPSGGGTPLTGTVTFDAKSRTASFVPANGFSSGVEYRVTVEGVRTTQGRGMQDAVTWTFTAA